MSLHLDELPCTDCGRPIAGLPKFDLNSRQPLHHLCLSSRVQARRAAAAQSAWIGKTVTWARCLKDQGRRTKTVFAVVVGLNRTGSLQVEFEWKGVMHKQTIHPDLVRVVTEKT